MNYSANVKSKIPGDQTTQPYLTSQAKVILNKITGENMDGQIWGQNKRKIKMQIHWSQAEIDFNNNTSNFHFVRGLATLRKILYDHVVEDSTRDPDILVR